jgi:hypothetical protein
MAYKKEKTDDPSIRDNINFASTIYKFITDMDRLLTLPNPNYDQYFRCVEHLKSKLHPYADEKFKNEYSKLVKSTSRPRVSPKASIRQRVTVEYYMRLEILLNELMQRVGLGLEEEGYEDII